jgi:hypothetical protein
MLWGLLYTSRAVRAMSEAELDSLLSESKERNAGWGITGWMTYAPGEGGGPGEFTQYFEGPRDAVRRLFYGEDEQGRRVGRGIIGDPRHVDVVVVQEGAFGGGPPGSRLYPRWFMEWVEVAKAAPQPIGRAGE